VPPTYTVFKVSSKSIVRSFLEITHMLLEDALIFTYSPKRHITSVC
jgi:hypothetical protein